MIILGLMLFACKPGTSTDEPSQNQGQDSSTVVEHEKVEVKKDAGRYVFKRHRNKHPQKDFINPVDSPILLAGTFCELRSNHFHGGLDIRTGGWEGWKVKSIAKGYVSRIKVSPYGYGNALYITHPNGYTSVYGHLKSFEGAIGEYVEAAQYEKRSFEIELFPSAKALPVSQGQIVAISGNTGGSQGPHLHFEIRDRSGQAVNPLLFGLDVKDEIPPIIKQVLVYHKDPEYLVSQGGYPMKKLKRGTAVFKGQVLKLKPGTYSFGMLAKDYFTDRLNRLGVNYCWLTVDGDLLYEYQIERMNFDLGRYINTHIDPYMKFKTGVQYVRLFKEKFNAYKYYRQDHNGEVFIKAGDSLLLQLYVEDYKGMRDSLQWTIVGDDKVQKLPFVDHYLSDTSFLATAGRTTHFTYGDWKLSIPGNAIYHNTEINLRKRDRRAGTLSNSLQIHYDYTPLHKHFQASIKVPEPSMKYGDKLCAVSFNGDRKVYEGGGLSKDRLHFKTRSFGEYALALDTIAPRIRPEGLSRNLRFRINDDLSGIKSYTLSIDDKWILMNYEPKTSLIWGRIPDWIKKGKHELKLIVVDDRNNSKKYTRNITL